MRATTGLERTTMTDEWIVEEGDEWLIEEQDELDFDEFIAMAIDELESEEDG